MLLQKSYLPVRCIKFALIMICFSKEWISSFSHKLFLYITAKIVLLEILLWIQLSFWIWGKWVLCSSVKSLIFLVYLFLLTRAPNLNICKQAFPRKKKELKHKFSIVKYLLFGTHRTFKISVFFPLSQWPLYIMTLMGHQTWL